MMLPLRIRKAEVALADGRLEEAWQQAIREDVRDHRKGQRLIGRLTKAYEKRARVHLDAGNHAAALTDAEDGLGRWVQHGAAFTTSLPPKKK